MRQFKAATITIPDFILAIFNDGEVLRTTKDELLASWAEADTYEGTGAVFFACCPSDGFMTDVTEDLAEAWWSKFGEVEGTVPECFSGWLEDRQQRLNERGHVDANAEHRTWNRVQSL